MTNLSTSHVLVQYLLGELSSFECEWVEEQYFLNPAVWQLLKETEDNLIDAYVYGYLPDRERGRFKSYSMTIPKIRERVEVTMTLKNLSA